MISRITYRSMMRGIASHYQPRAPRIGRQSRDGETGPAVAHAPAVLRGPRDRRAHPALGPAACDQGLLGHGRPCSRNSRGVRVTFNLVPSLVRQVQAFAENRARDRHLEIGLKPAEQLTPDEARWMVANGFHAPYGRMIGPYPRYAELHAASHGAPDVFGRRPSRSAGVAQAGVDGSRLARRAIRGSSRWSSKDRGFTRRRQGAAAQGRARDAGAGRPGVPRRGARAARSSSRPRRSTIRSCRCCATRTRISVRIRVRRSPRRRFRRPDDARLQIERAIAFHEATFGSRPPGMWPSEGSVSDEAVGADCRGGARLDRDRRRHPVAIASAAPIATPELLYRPYRIGEAGPVALFRDHAMSDRIGFHYQSWDPDAAAD